MSIQDYLQKSQDKLTALREAEDAKKKKAAQELNAEWTDFKTRVSMALPDDLRPFLVVTPGDTHPSWNSQYARLEIPECVPVYAGVSYDFQNHIFLPDTKNYVAEMDGCNFDWEVSYKELDVAVAIAHERYMQQAKQELVYLEEDI
jgi:hypothetical protein